MLFGPLDLAAVAFLFGAWVGIGWLIEHSPRWRPSTASLMVQYRREWMVQFITRQPRIFDASIIANLRQGTAFFASASMIAIGGGLALIGNADMLRGVAGDLLPDSTDPVVVWEIKLLVILVFAANAFLKFVWSHRLFGYCSVVMASVPNDVDDPLALTRAAQAAELNVTAAQSYNRGLRAVYFGIGACAWLIGPGWLVAGTAVTLIVIGRREFASRSRSVLLGNT